MNNGGRRIGRWHGGRVKDLHFLRSQIDLSERPMVPQTGAQFNCDSEFRNDSENDSETQNRY